MLSWLKWAFAGLSIGSVVLAGYFMLTAKHSIQEVLDIAAIQAGSKVNNPDIKAYDGDKLSWRLQAESAVEQGDVLVLERPVIDLYTEDRQVIPIQSQAGRYQKKKGLVHLKGAVHMVYQGWTLQSETLDYQQEKDVLYIKTKFTMEKEGMKIKGKNMRILQEKGRVSIKEGVHMEIEENK